MSAGGSACSEEGALVWVDLGISGLHSAALEPGDQSWAGSRASISRGQVSGTERGVLLCLYLNPSSGWYGQLSQGVSQAFICRGGGSVASVMYVLRTETPGWAGIPVGV